jgi:hypothetical protein
LWTVGYVVYHCPSLALFSLLTHFNRIHSIVGGVPRQAKGEELEFLQTTRAWGLWCGGSSSLHISTITYRLSRWAGNGASAVGSEQ